MNEQQNSEQQKSNCKLIVSELQDDIDKIDVDYVRVVTNDDDDIVLMKQKGKDTIKEIEKHMDRVKTRWNIQSENWGKGFISGIDGDQIADAFQVWKQSA